MILLNLTTDYCTLNFSINYLFLVIFVIVLFIFLNKDLLVWLTDKLFNKFKIKDFTISEFNLGIGGGNISIKPDFTDREIAYKLWIELSTRKLGQPVDFNEDVIVELYDSWYSFFGVARNLLKEFPISKLNSNNENDLIEITIRLLNDVLRVHLTKYQAKFRKWYGEELEKSENNGLTPQQIQRKYEFYNELTEDIININNRIDYYMDVLYSISHDKKIKQ